MPEPGWVGRDAVVRRPVDPAPRPYSILVKASLDQRLKFFHCLVGVRTFAADKELGPLSSGKHHQTHDAFAIYHFPLFRYPDFRAVTTRYSHEHGRRSCVKSQPIGNRKIFFNLPVRLGAARFPIQQTHQPAPLPPTPEVAAGTEAGRSIKLSSLALKSTALFWPRPFNFSSIAATSIKRAMSRPGRTGIVTCGT